MILEELINQEYLRTEDGNVEFVGVIIFDNPVVRKLVCAWPGVTKNYDPKSFVVEGMWENVVFSYDEWLSLAGLPPSKSNFTYAENSIKSGYVFPDGRIHFGLRKCLMIFTEKRRKQ